MKTGKLTIDQVRGIMREIEAEGEKALSDSFNYETHEYASGVLRGGKKVLHSVFLESGLRWKNPQGLVESTFCAEFDAWWAAMESRIEFHWNRIKETRQ